MWNIDIKTIGILGGNGFLGSNLVDFFKAGNYEVSAITKETFQDFKGISFDLFINANGNSKKFWANQNPVEDYKLSVESVKNSFLDFEFKKYIFVSSSDVYPGHESPENSKEIDVIEKKLLEPYGLHKLQAEELVKKLPDFLILRMSAMVGTNLKKGVVKDILAGSELFITEDSYLQFITTEEVGKIIQFLLDKRIKNETYNCGGKGSVTVNEMFGIFGKKNMIKPEAKKQEYEMNVEKLSSIFNLKTSKEYLKKFKQQTL